MAGPALADTRIVKGEIFGYGEDLGVISDAVSEFFTRCYVSGEALVVDVASFVGKRTAEEGSANGESFLEDGTLFG